MSRPFRHPPASAIGIDAVLHALADPIRRGVMVKLLGCDGLSCSKACSDLSPSTISFHHRVLREAGLIRSEKRGVEVINTARKAEIDVRFPGLLDAILRHHGPP
ncbi:ArsR/SmtB family transcription factor [Dokdonella koreensis]|uniref:Transcriptional regulator, ArsR family n=1 Tax=Dokdonella koreensis DS-123 TaxID=1300342 RepID=A0A160DS27_9GAMM|nr:helix-turn-helix domain-containing protein [Dokdonella koreensis]ANB17057.1 Transcriptional regulator, ArsR family [Dokdonella koreensis DS-123]